MSHGPSHNPAIEKLLKTQPGIWRGRDTGLVNDALKTGFADLDSALPAGGWQPGTLTELMIAQHGSGEFSLLLPTLKQATSQQWAALVQPPYQPYAPALANAGVRLDRLLIVDTDQTNESVASTDTLWATEQLLRSGLFSVVVCWLDRTDAQKQRRLQLAAEAGQAWCAAYRPASTANDHSPAALRLQLAMQSGCMMINIIKSRGAGARQVSIPATDFDTHQGIEWPVALD